MSSHPIRSSSTLRKDRSPRAHPPNSRTSQPSSVTSPPFFSGHADPAHRLDHDHVLVHLERELARLDGIATRGDTMAFGRNSEALFDKLDDLREEQVALALSHMALDKLPEPETHPKDDEATAAEAYTKDAAALDKKIIDLSGVTERLESLTKSMENFQVLSSTMARQRWDVVEEEDGESERTESEAGYTDGAPRAYSPLDVTMESEGSREDFSTGSTIIRVPSSGRRAYREERG
ncbi:MAG: hypothetical protein DHS80DRAFT_32500 [Piptocephalis tieghemiana]|nr:MAG: hypothetical protein DHS80DRAFT_32500 [Piptocephalis tieghemiana]